MGGTTSCRGDERRGGSRAHKEPTAPADPGELGEAPGRREWGESKNILVEQYMPLVRAVSARLAAELPSSIDTDDLVSAGTFGLMDAIERYDPKLGTRFGTYCALRIRGAILDELRHLNWVPRTQQTRAAKVSAVSAALKSKLGRTPTPGEIARKTGLKLSEVNSPTPSGQNHASLMGAPRDSGSEDVRGIDVLEAEGVCDPADVLQEKERRGILDREVRKLPRAERLLVMLYYFEGLTMKQVGKVLNITESRVCQIHTRLLRLLQQRLAELDESRPRPD